MSVKEIIGFKWKKAASQAFSTQSYRSRAERPNVDSSYKDDTGRFIKMIGNDAWCSINQNGWFTLEANNISLLNFLIESGAVQVLAASLLSNIATDEVKLLLSKDNPDLNHPPHLYLAPASLISYIDKYFNGNNIDLINSENFKYDCLDLFDSSIDGEDVVSQEADVDDIDETLSEESNDDFDKLREEILADQEIHIQEELEESPPKIEDEEVMEEVSVVDEVVSSVVEEEIVSHNKPKTVKVNRTVTPPKDIYGRVNVIERAMEDARISLMKEYTDCFWKGQGMSYRKSVGSDNRIAIMLFQQIPKIYEDIETPDGTWFFMIQENGEVVSTQTLIDDCSIVVNKMMQFVVS